MTSFQYTRKPPVYERIVFIDGQTRAGKSLVGRIVSHVEGGEQWRSHVSIESMCYLHALGQIDESAAAPFLQYVVEEYTYNQIIGRYLNTRQSDLSSVYRSPDPDAILNRAKVEDGMAAVERFEKEKGISAFQIHSALMSSSLVLRALPAAKILHINRHPVDLVYKWYQRGWGERETNDPLSFVPVLETPAGVVPWFAQGWEEAFVQGNHFERIIDSILHLTDWDDRGYDALDEKQKQQIFRFTLEDLVTSPETVVEQMSSFLGTTPRAEMEAMLLEERCPRELHVSDRQEMFLEIKETISPEHAERLSSASRDYEARWSIAPFAT